MKAVRIIIIAIGPEARKPKYRQVLEFIGGKNLFFVNNYASIGEAIQDITTLICRKCNLMIPSLLMFFLFVAYEEVGWRETSGAL